MLSAGALSIASAQIPFNIRDGRLRVGATTLAADGVRAVVSGGYDIPADQADIRATPRLRRCRSVRPAVLGIQLFAAGTPDALNRTIDVTALSSWLAVRTIDRETRRLDAIERGEPPPPPPPPLVIPLEPQEAPDAVASTPPVTDAPMPGRDPRRLPQKPKISAPRPTSLPPVANAPPVNLPPSIASQPQVAPLPPPIDVKPAPGAVMRPKPRPPLSLTPQVANPPQRPALQNSN